MKGNYNGPKGEGPGQACTSKIETNAFHKEISKWNEEIDVQTLGAKWKERGRF